MSKFALQPAALEPAQVRLAALEVRLADRERELTLATQELQQLQADYLRSVGGFYAQLAEIEGAIFDEEVRLGLRRPFEPDAESKSAGESESEVAGAGCSARGAPSSDLKAMFRTLAKNIHPDLALDEPARWRRHSLMAEANRAYAERDEDRLRLILHAWTRDPDSTDTAGATDDDPAVRVQRRVASIEARLLAIDRELGELRGSAISRLKQKIDAARDQGWDLFAEMLLEIQREIRRAAARLAVLTKERSSRAERL